MRLPSSFCAFLSSSSHLPLATVRRSAVCKKFKFVADRTTLLVTIFTLILVMHTVDATQIASAQEAAAERSTVPEFPAEALLFDRDVRAPRPKFIRFGRAGQKFIRFGRSSSDYNSADIGMDERAARLLSDEGAAEYIYPFRRYFSSPKRAQKFIRFG